MLKRLSSSTLSEFVDAKSSAAFLRIFASFFMFYGHGWGKLMRVFSGDFQFLDPLGIGAAPTLLFATFAEGICSLLILIGYKTRLAAIFLILNMSGAFLFVHLSQEFGKMEPALLYLTMFITIFLLGPGKYSID